MDEKAAIDTLDEIKYQFEVSLTEAELEEEFALEAQEDNESAVKAIDKAIEVLEKQIAKKPSLVGMQNKCPNIDCFESVLRHFNYCSECGQKIDWNKD